MRRVAFVVVLAAVLAGTVVALAEATQSRPDVRPPGSTTVVAFSVDVQRYPRGEAAAAATLWSVCAGSVEGDVSAAPVRDGRGWRATVTPAVGEHGRRKLVGCLEDATVDRVVGRVLSISALRHATL